jgi:hypothetical protein
MIKKAQLTNRSQLIYWAASEGFTPTVVIDPPKPPPPEPPPPDPVTPPKQASSFAEDVAGFGCIAEIILAIYLLVLIFDKTPGGDNSSKIGWVVMAIIGILIIIGAISNKSQANSDKK